MTYTEDLNKKANHMPPAKQHEPFIHDVDLHIINLMEHENVFNVVFMKTQKGLMVYANRMEGEPLTGESFGDILNQALPIAAEWA